VGNSWNFAGELTSSVRTHVGKGDTTTVANRYEYEHMGRKLATFEKINQDGEVALSHFEYEGIGQLKVKHLHNDQQHTSFAYNERGWLKGIRSNEFSMELKYDVAVNGVSNQFNGNIANQVFNNGNGDNTFNYSYDKLNRLTVGEVSSTLLSERLSYDVMGNIMGMILEIRKGLNQALAIMTRFTRKIIKITSLAGLLSFVVYIFLLDVYL